MSANLTEAASAAAVVIGQLIVPVSNIGGIPIQCSIEEEHTAELEQTDQPAEAGSNFTDHSFMHPVELLMRCGWSNSQSGSGVLGAIASLGALASLVSGSSAATGSFSAGTMTASDYVSSVASQLFELQQARQPISVTSSLVTYSSMLIKSLRVTRDQTTFQALMVEAVFKQAIIVTTQTTTLAPQANQANPASTAETQALGTVQVQSATPAPGGSLPPSSWTATPDDAASLVGN